MNWAQDNKITVPVVSECFQGELKNMGGSSPLALIKNHPLTCTRLFALVCTFAEAICVELYQSPSKYQRLHRLYGTKVVQTSNHTIDERYIRGMQRAPGVRVACPRLGVSQGTILLTIERRKKQGGTCSATTRILPLL